MTALERELGLTLIARTTREAGPTEAGRILFEYARQMLDLRQKAKEELYRFATELSGTVTVAASSIPGRYFLPRTITAFQKRYPDVKFDLRMPSFDRVAPNKAVKDLSKATIALCTSGGIVPKGNPDHIESSSASHYGEYCIKGVEKLTSETYETAHGGYDPVYANENPNRVLPVDVLRELEKEGKIGKLHDYYYATVGNGTAVASAKKFAAEYAQKLLQANVNAVIMTNLFDGVSFVIQKNSGEEAAQGGVSEEQVKSLIAKAMEEEGSVSYWAVLFKADNFSDLLDRLDAVNEIMNADQAVIDQLKALQDEISQKEASLQSSKADSEAAKTDLESKKSALESQRKQANQLIQQLASNQDETEAAIDGLAEEEEAIQKRIQDMSRKLAEEQAAANGGKVSNAALGGYIWPVDSHYVTSTFGGRASPGGIGSTNHKGVDIGRVGYTTTVHAAKAGTVLIAQRSSSYGNYVVISHGPPAGSAEKHSGCGRGARL